MQVSLLGMVTANMLAVLVSWNDAIVNIRVVFDGTVLPPDYELLSELESEVISHLPTHRVFCRGESCLVFEKISSSADEVFVFRRAPN